jgi:hypothetical protein
MKSSVKVVEEVELDDRARPKIDVDRQRKVRELVERLRVTAAAAGSEAKSRRQVETSEDTSRDE